MDDPISARFQLIEDEVVEANRIARRINREQTIPTPFLRWCVRALFVFLGVCWIILGTVGLISSNGIIGQGRPNTPSFIMLGLGVLALFWPFFRDKTCRWLVLRSIRKSPDKDVVIEWVISDEELSVQSPLASSRFHWKLVKQVVDAPNGFLIYTNKIFAHWIPIHAFDAKDGADRFQELARSRVSNYVVLGSGRRALARDLPKTLLNEI